MPATLPIVQSYGRQTFRRPAWQSRVKWPPGKSLQSELKMFNVWMWGSSSWPSAPAAVAVPGHVI
ncbi:hypothetical protein T09_12112 [Trichinella sp. T9]|nr:hypothetical protein T09_12112 [Trichinella sp. T9]